MGPTGQPLPRWNTILPVDPSLFSYNDRAIPPEETLRRVWPHLGELGITRVARQTDLDRAGVPTWACFRPNSMSLSGSQGKGITDAAACASAVMEAVEVAVAEQPRAERTRTSADELTAAGVAWFAPTKLLPFGTEFDTARTIDWFEGRAVGSGAPIRVPASAVDMDCAPGEFGRLCKTSNGLAAGNSVDEATFHGLCELVERDGTTLWSLLDEPRALATCFDAAALNDPVVDELAARLARAGLVLRLFDQTTDLGLPVVMAALGPAEGWVGELDLTAGYGAHPNAARAALRAITEAAQSRVTGIAGSRDDIAKSAFKRQASPLTRALLTSVPQAAAPKLAAPGLPLARLLGLMVDRLQPRCVVVVVSIDGGAFPFSVVKVLSNDLEDRGANINWRPGWRCFDALEAVA